MESEVFFFFFDRDALDAIQATWLGVQMRSIYWLFPMTETIHFIGLSVMFAGLLVMDLRVLGVAPFISMRTAMKFVPVTLIAFGVMVLTGMMFLSADPHRYFPNLSFQWKMGLMFVAGLNALWFWLGEHKELVQLADGEQADFRAKVIALLSILVWIAILVFGRMIPYLEF